MRGRECKTCGHLMPFTGYAGVDKRQYCGRSCASRAHGAAPLAHVSNAKILRALKAGPLTTPELRAALNITPTAPLAVRLYQLSDRGMVFRRRPANSCPQLWALTPPPA